VDVIRTELSGYLKHVFLIFLLDVIANVGVQTTPQSKQGFAHSLARSDHRFQNGHWQSSYNRSHRTLLATKISRRKSRVTLVRTSVPDRSYTSIGTARIV
jgi:hypothetical protein